MLKVAVSGVMGQLGAAIARGVTAAEGMQLTGAYSPGREGEFSLGLPLVDDPTRITADVLVECAPPDAVMGNLQAWHDQGFHVVVGTSGFTEDRLAELESLWTNPDLGCLVVPNFSIGAVLAMHFAEQAASWFDSVEIIERHEKHKPDAPSGTALATAMRVGRARGSREQPPQREIVAGARGGPVSGVPVHSLRLTGLLSDQEVAFSNRGETFSLLHRSTSYESFVDGALLAIRQVGNRPGVSFGLDSLLGLSS